MNSLLFYPEEVVDSSGKAILTGARAEYVSTWHDLAAGIEVEALLYGRAIGRAKILTVKSERIEAQVVFDRKPPVRSNATLIVAVPRPQTVKKVLETSASLGINALFFIRTEKVQKSYLQSKSLTEHEIQHHITRGLEQACDPIAPKVAIHMGTFPQFIKENTPQLTSNDTCFLVADTRAETSSLIGKVYKNQKQIVLALGPESGWSKKEVVKFKELGAHCISLGPRVLRVETALAVTLGQIQTLT